MKLLGSVKNLIIFAALVALLITFVVRTIRLPKTEAEAAQAIVDGELARLEKADPQAAQILQGLRDRRGEQSLAPAFRVAESGAVNPMSALRELASRSKDERTPYEVQLTDIARRSVNLNDPEESQAFFHSHATACNLLTNDTSGRSTDRYLSRLEEAAQNPAAWRVVKDDPVALLIWRQLAAEPDLLQYYEGEREWLAEVLADLELVSAEATAHPSPELEESAARAAEKSYVDAIRVAKKYHPLPKQAATDLQLGSLGFSLFIDFGPIIRIAVGDYSLPLDETLEVLFINGDRFRPSDNDALSLAKADEFARELVQVRKARPQVWEFARTHPLALRLNHDVPKYADQLLDKFGGNDVCAFLYTNYEKEIAPAAGALATFGDLGFYILKTYEDDSRLKARLADPKVGILIVPFMARYGAEGFDKLDDDTAWVTRYFNADGTPRKDDWEWMKAVPILGAPAHLVANIANGHPTEWSEWGWAALDVADGALLVASFGASAEVSVAKQALKEGTKEGIELVGKQQAKTLARSAAKRSAGTVGKSGARVGVRQVQRSALQRLVQSGSRAMLSTSKFAVVAGRNVARVADPVVAGARRLKNTWTAVPVNVKRWVYRSLLAVGMMITIHERVIPALPAFGEAVGTEIGRLLNSAGSALADAFAAAMREGLGLTRGQIGFWIAHIIACLLLALLAWRWWPLRRPELRAV